MQNLENLDCQKSWIEKKMPKIMEKDFIFAIGLSAEFYVVLTKDVYELF